MTEPGKILVIQLRQIGDVVLTTTAVRALRARFPGARIDFLVAPPAHQVLEGHPAVDNVLVYDKALALRWIRRVRAERYDWVVDFLSNPRSAWITLFSGAAVKAGWKQTGLSFLYNVKLEQTPGGAYVPLEKANALAPLGVPTPADVLPDVHSGARARAKGPGPHVGFAPMSRRKTREWPARRWVELGRKLAAEDGARVSVFWGPGEKDACARIARECGAALAEETPHLLDLAARLSELDVLVTNCNGPKHLATAVGTRTVTVFGSSDPVAWNPPGDPRHLAVLPERARCGDCDPDACAKCLAALAAIPAERVYADVRAALDAVEAETLR